MVVMATKKVYFSSGIPSAISASGTVPGGEGPVHLDRASTWLPSTLLLKSFASVLMGEKG